MEVFKIIGDILIYAFFAYAIFLMSSYVILAIISFKTSSTYKKKNEFIDYDDILVSELAPSVTLIAPAYNEGMTIIENVRSLLSINYANFEVLIINDGSKDDTLEKLKETYELERVNYAVNYKVETKEVKGVYKSKNAAFSHLVVVDKVNGGKADALNVGVNIASCDYIACIDVDCVLEPDSILKLMKPFLEEEREVIATGGVIRIANSCEIESGQLKKINVPTSWIARIQVVEYFRAFLLGRMAWSKLDGLLLISGALGVFKKDRVIEVGGYDHNTVGEDMELVMRLSKYMGENELPFKVAFIPDPLCWTEAPDNWKIWTRQRNRWTRGTIECLLAHKDMMLNPKHKVLGMLSVPYWFLFEWLAPITEALGYVLVIVSLIFGWINWTYFVLMFVFVYSFAVIFSAAALLIEELTYHQYEKQSQVWKLFWISLLEPFFYHPMVVYAAIRGNIDFLTGKSNWGEMTRSGFKKTDQK